mgnify:CR=1 FL=1
MFFVPKVSECEPTGTVKLSVISKVRWSSAFPCDDASVPTTMLANVVASERGMPRIVICGNCTGTVRKSSIVVRFTSSSL